MSLHGLTKDTLCHMLSFLDNQSLGRLMSTCKHFRELGQSEKVQKVFIRNLEPLIDLKSYKATVVLSFLKLNKPTNWQFQNEKMTAVSGKFFEGNSEEIRKLTFPAWVSSSSGEPFWLFEIPEENYLVVDKSLVYKTKDLSSDPEQNKCASKIAGNWRCITLLDDSYALVLHLKEKKNLSEKEKQCQEQFEFTPHEYHLGLFDYVKLKTVCDFALTDFEDNTSKWWGVSVEEGCVHLKK